MAKLTKLLPSACAASFLLFALLLLCASTFKSSWLRRPLTEGCSETLDLDGILRQTAMPNRTLIITALNEAWATPNSMIDLFLQSFNTTRLVNHLLIVALDGKSYERCLSVHSHCFQLKAGGVDFSGSEKLFMTPDYLSMMWARIKFLQEVLEKGFSFIFSDADILWFRDPFQYLSSDADFQVSCDFYVGNPSSLANRVNTGFLYAHANNRTINFYKYWYMARETFPGLKEQDVLNEIKHDKALKEIGVQMRFFDTKHISCFCQPSDDFEELATMHANCCFGLQSKLEDLRLILADWNRYQFSTNRSKEARWSAPKACLGSDKVLKEP